MIHEHLEIIIKNGNDSNHRNEKYNQSLVKESHVKLTFEGSRIYLRLPAISVRDRRRVLLGCAESHGGMSAKKWKEININFIYI